MRNNNENKLVPKLRFPEFKNCKKWEGKKLGEVAKFLKGKGISKSDVIENGKLPCIRYGQLYTHYKETINEVISYTDLSSDNLVLSLVNDVIIPSSGETQDDIATASCVMKNGIALGGDLNIIRTDISGVFLSYYLNNAKKKDIAQMAQGISVVHLYSTQLKTLNIIIPQKPEQQKIAACLSSLDEVITAESQKLEALKEHKKGLLQNLFPQEGETVPKFRFPEFHKSGDWERKSLDEIANVVASGDLDTNSFSPLRTNVHIYPVYSNSVTQEGLYGFSSNSKYKRNSVTITARGTLGVAFVRESDFVGIGRLLVISNLKNIQPQFLKESWNYQAKIPLENGGIPQLTAVKAKSVVLFFPKFKEQQKIADCLSSLDEVITAQSQKVETLKLHKKGLLQGLFPDVNGVSE